jgi:hypothetical protein
MKALVLTALLLASATAANAESLCPGWTEMQRGTVEMRQGGVFLTFPTQITGPYFLVPLQGNAVLGKARVVSTRRGETLVLLQGPEGAQMRVILCMRQW